MTELSIDGRSARLSGATETILEVARALGIDVPTLCHGGDLPHRPSCMVCLVEDETSGRLVPACATPAVALQRVRTDTERVRAARRRSVELLLTEHAGDCVAPCARACPAGVDIPGVIRRMRAGDLAASGAVLARRLPLAASIERACPAPCERSCRRRLVDAPLDIRGLLAAAARGATGVTARVAAPPSGRTVAVVGAGPAGCSAAYFLARAGHRCLLLESRPAAGGALRCEVDPARLPAAVLDADIEVLQALGVEMRLGVTVEEPELAALRKANDAVVIATGSTASLAALLPGLPTALDGVFVAGNALRDQPSRVAARAVADGRRVARSVGRFLGGRQVAPAPRPFDSRRGPVTAEHIAAAAARTAGSVSEDGRCMECDCRAAASCALRRLAETLGADPARFAVGPVQSLELERGRGGISFEPGKCIRCGLCVRIARRAGDLPGLAFSGRGEAVRVRVPFRDDLGDALAASAAECVQRCPTGALAWDRRTP